MLDWQEPHPSFMLPPATPSDPIQLVCRDGTRGGRGESPERKNVGDVPALAGIRLSSPLPDDFEEEDGRRGGDVERADLAGQGDGQDLVAGLADKGPQAPPLRAEDDADGAGVVERKPGLVPRAFGAEEPEALVLELFHGPDEIGDPGDKKMLARSRRDRVDGLGKSRRTALG